MRRNLTGASALLLVLMLTVTGCASGNSGREVIHKPGKTITVLPGELELHVNSAALIRVERIKDRVGLGWVNEDSLLLAATGPSADQLVRQRMLVYRTEGKQEEELPAALYNQAEAELSPSRTHVYYKETEGINATATGYIMSLKDRVPIRVTESGGIHVKEGHWADSSHVVYTTLDGTIYETDLAGNRTVLLQTGDKTVRESFRLKGRICYVTGDHTLKETDPATGSTTVLAEQVYAAVPSPAGDQMALVKKNKEDDYALVILSSKTAKERIIAKGKAFYSPSWSDDGRMLAYSVSSEAIGRSGLFLTTGEENSVIQLSADVFPGYPIRFSPSGGQLLASKATLDQERHILVAYLLTININ